MKTLILSHAKTLWANCDVCNTQILSTDDLIVFDGERTEAGSWIISEFAFRHRNCTSERFTHSRRICEGIDDIAASAQHYGKCPRFFTSGRNHVKRMEHPKRSEFGFPLPCAPRTSDDWEKVDNLYTLSLEKVKSLCGEGNQFAYYVSGSTLIITVERTKDELDKNTL